jgi:HEAT repeat protein
MVKAALNDLRSANPKVVSNAAVRLGECKIKAAVPVLLEVLQSPGSLTISEHVNTGGMRRWIAIDPKWRIVEALGAIGDKRAVPLLEGYLRAPPAGLELAAQNLASALFLITGVRYRYRDNQGNFKRYAPGEFEEEEVRRRFSLRLRR